MSLVQFEQKVLLAYMYLRWFQRCFNHAKPTGNANNDYGN